MECEDYDPPVGDVTGAAAAAAAMAQSRSGPSLVSLDASGEPEPALGVSASGLRYEDGVQAGAGEGGEGGGGGGGGGGGSSAGGALRTRTSFNSIGAKQPFRVVVRPEAAFVCDAHAHMCKNEVIGFLAGKWHVKERVVEIVAAFPCRSLSDTEDQSVNVEMDPVSELQIRHIIGARGLSIVGWYHSHPTFQSDPSVRDIENQTAYQLLFRTQQEKKRQRDAARSAAAGAPSSRGGRRRGERRRDDAPEDAAADGDSDVVHDEPFVGIIVGPYDPRLPTERSWFCLFHVVRASEAAAIAALRSPSNRGANPDGGAGEDAAPKVRLCILLFASLVLFVSLISSLVLLFALFDTAPKRLKLGDGDGDEDGDSDEEDSGSDSASSSKPDVRERNAREIRLTLQRRASTKKLASRSLGHPMRVRGECGIYSMCGCSAVASAPASLSQKLLARAAARRRAKRGGGGAAAGAAAADQMHVFDASLDASLAESSRPASPVASLRPCAPNAPLSVRMKHACDALTIAFTERACRPPPRP